MKDALIAINGRQIPKRIARDGALFGALINWMAQTPGDNSTRLEFFTAFAKELTPAGHALFAEFGIASGLVGRVADEVEARMTEGR